MCCSGLLWKQVGQNQKGGKRKMRSWYLRDPAEQCSVAILEELGLGVVVGDGLGMIETLELSAAHLGSTFIATLNVSVSGGGWHAGWEGVDCDEWQELL